MAKPLGIALGIDFGKLDRDLGQVAGRIEAVGKSAKIRLGGADGIDLGKSADIGNIGEKLAAGIASGVRSAGSLMLGFAAHVDSILNRVSGAAITLFRRIDDAMKFPAFDAFFRGASAKLGNFAAFWRKPLSDVDLAVRGAFGGMAASIAKIFKVMIDQLASAISGALKDAVSQVVAEFGRLNTGIGRAEASAAGLLANVEKTKVAANQFDMGKGGLRTSIPGPRIGAGTTFTAQAVRAPMPPVQLELWPKIRAEVEATGKALVFLGLIPVRVGAAFASLGLGIIGSFRRVFNFFGSLGDVTGKTFDQIYRGGIRIATLGIFGQADAQARGFNRTLGTTTTSLGQVSGALKSVGVSLLAAFGVVGVLYKVVQFFKDGVKGASDLNEAANKSKVVFGSAFGSIEQQANAMNKRFGISRQAQLDVASGFGAMAQGAGYTEQASAELSNRLTKLAADFSSSANLSFGEAGQKIRSALAGEAEPLRQFGVVIDENTVKAYAYSNGLARAGQELSAQAKITARAELIARGLAYAQGDLERTSGDAANQFRKAGGGIQEFGVRIGELLLPAINAGTTAFNEFLAVTLDAFQGIQPVVTSWASVVTGAFERVGVVVRNLGSFWKIAQLRVGEFVINTISWIETIPQNVGPIWQWLGRNWSNLLTDMLSALQAFGTNLLANAANLGSALWDALKTGELNFSWTPLLEGFKATTEQLPELIKPDLISVDDEVNRILGEIGKKEAARTAALAGPALAKPGALDAMDKAAKEQEYKLASAVEIGSKEASSIVARTQATGRAGGQARDQLGVAKDSNSTLKEIRDAVKNPKPLAKVM